MTNDLGYTCCHRNCGYTSGTDKRIGFTTIQNTHDFTKDNACKSTSCESDQTKNNDQNSLIVQEGFSFHSQTCTSCQHDRYNVHQSILCSIGKTIQTTSFFEQVTQHQHTNQRAYRRKQQADNDSSNNREYDSFKMRNRTQLFHNDFTVSFSSAKFHNRRLDQRNQRHIRICSYCDST